MLKHEVKQDLSVVYSVFNGSYYVSAWVQDVAQLLKLGIQVILVVDAPTDDTLEKIASKVSKHVNLSIVSLKKNVGPASARNIGLKYCNRNFVIFCDFDDRIIPSNLLNFFTDFQKTESNVGVANFGWKLKNSRQEPIFNLDDYIPDPNFMNLPISTKQIDLISTILPWPVGVWRMCFSVEYLRAINACWFPTYDDLEKETRISEDVFFLHYIVLNNPKIYFWNSKDIIYIYGFCEPLVRSFKDYKIILFVIRKYLNILEKQSNKLNHAYLAQFIINTLWNYLPYQDKKDILNYVLWLMLISMKVIVLNMKWVDRLQILIVIFGCWKNASKSLLLRIIRRSNNNNQSNVLLFVKSYLSL